MGGTVGRCNIHFVTGIRKKEIKDSRVVFSAHPPASTKAGGQLLHGQPFVSNEEDKKRKKNKMIEIISIILHFGCSNSPIVRFEPKSSNQASPGKEHNFYAILNIIKRAGTWPIG